MLHLALLLALGVYAEDGNVCNYSQLATYNNIMEKGDGQCAMAIETSFHICKCIASEANGERADLLDLNCRLSTDSEKTVAEFTQECLVGECQIFEGLGKGDGEFQRDERKKINGEPTYWRNDGEAFWYSCGEKYEGLWAVAGKSHYGRSDTMQCRGWASAPMLPTEDASKMEVVHEGELSAASEEATATVKQTICSIPKQLSEDDGDEECMRIANLSNANGNYQADTTKMINSEPTMWSDDLTHYWYFCGADYGFWMLARAYTYEGNAALDAERIQMQAERRRGFWGTKCRGLYQASRDFASFKAFEDGNWRNMNNARVTTTEGACGLEMPAPFEPITTVDITFTPPKCGTLGGSLPAYLPSFVPNVPIPAFDTCFLNPRNNEHYKFECMQDGRLKEKLYKDDSECKDQKKIHEEAGGEAHHAFLTNGVCNMDGAGVIFTMTLAWDAGNCPKADCEVGEWGRWSSCNVSCGEGVQSRKREVIQEQLGNGATCRGLVETRSCILGECPPRDICEDENMQFRRASVRGVKTIGETASFKEMLNADVDAALCACVRHCQDMDDDRIKFWALDEKKGKCTCFEGYKQLKKRATHAIGGMDDASIQAIMDDEGKKVGKDKSDKKF